MSEELIARIATDTGSTLVRVDDVTEVTLELADRLEAQIVEGAAAFTELVEERRRSLAERTAARTALELMKRPPTPEAEPLVVNDVAGLRALVKRLADADRLIAAADEDARQRAGTASGLTVHPSSIRDAAADVLEARANVLERNQELQQLIADEPTGHDEPTEASDPDDAAPPLARQPGLRLTDVSQVRTAAVVAGAALSIGLLVVILTGSPTALVLPAVGMLWLTVVVVRQRDDSYDDKIASRNLENVARLTDRAYGGVGLVEEQANALRRAPERLAAERALDDARDRLAYAESAWRSLVGPNADVDDVESVLRSHDAQYGVSDAVVVELPSHRAASAHRRRLHAQWKLAWWTLDRPVPALSDAAAAIDALEAEGIDEVILSGVTTGGSEPDERSRLDELAAGRSEDELRSVADTQYAPVVVADTEREIDEDRLRAETAQLPDDVRFVVVAPVD